MKPTRKQSCAMVLDTRLDALKAAISSRDWQQAQLEYDRVRRSFGKLNQAIPQPGQLASIAFQPESHDTAAAFFRLLKPRSGPNEEGHTVTVVPVVGEPFDAEFLDVECDEQDGQYKLLVAEWDEEQGRGDRSRVRRFDIYDELERIEVI